MPLYKLFISHKVSALNILTHIEFSQAIKKFLNLDQPKIWKGIGTPLVGFNPNVMILNKSNILLSNFYSDLPYNSNKVNTSYLWTINIT